MVQTTNRYKGRDEGLTSKVLFPPVYGNRKSPARKISGSVSQQQHATRNYHRQVKLRQGRKTTDTSKSEEMNGPEPQSWQNLDLPDSPPICPQNRDSPLTALGAGRLDPFDTYCVENPTLIMHEVLDHALSHQWSIFRCSKGLESLNAIKADVMKCVMSVRVSWYTVLYAGATFYAFNYGQRYPPQLNEPLRLSFKDEALKCLRNEISQNGIPSDEMLLSMVVLAAHGSGEVPKLGDRKKSWTVSILANSYNNDYFGGMEICWHHMKALKVLVASRGGLSAIKVKTVAMAIQLYDVFSSWRTFRRPMFPLVRPTSYFMGLRSHRPDAAAMNMSRTLASDLLSMQVPNDHQLLRDLLQIVQNAATLVIDLDQWTRGTADPPDMVHIEFTRWCVVHNLLSLPELSENSSKILNGRNDDLMHDLIRFTTMAFLLFTLNSLTESGDLPLKIAEKIRTNLDTCVLRKSCSDSGPCVEQPGLFLWSVILGGMCAYAADGPPPCEKSSISDVSSPLLDAYIVYADHLTLKAESYAWPLVVNLMGRYLWMESECNELGEVLWNHLCKRHAKDASQQQP